MIVRMILRRCQRLSRMAASLCQANRDVVTLVMASPDTGTTWAKHDAGGRVRARFAVGSDDSRMLPDLHQRIRAGGIGNALTWSQPFLSPAR